MKNKNVRLLIVVLILIVANTGLFVWQPSFANLDYNPGVFAVSDSSAITEIVFESEDFKNEFARQSSWKLNGNVASDLNLRRILFAVFERVRVARKLGEQEASQWLEKSGVDVSIRSGSDVISYRVVGNSTQTRTFFISDNQVFEMEIPGYRDFVGGIFQLTPDQWRDRLVVNGNWRTIQVLEAKYSDGSGDFIMRFHNEFYTVDGLEQIDSTAVVDYLNQFAFLQANERISRGLLDTFDSLMDTPPELIIRLEDIKYATPIEVGFYPLMDGQNIRLARDQNGEFMVFEQRRIAPIFKRRSDFAF